MPKKKTKRTSKRTQPLKPRFEVLQQGNTPLPDNLTDDTMLKREQAATYANCSLRTIITWITDKGLPEVKTGKVSRIRKGDLDQFLKNAKIKEQPATPAQPTDITETQEFREAYEVMWNIGNPAYSGHTFGMDFDSDMKVFKDMEEWEAKVKRVRQGE